MTADERLRAALRRLPHLEDTLLTGRSALDAPRGALDQAAFIADAGMAWETFFGQDPHEALADALALADRILSLPD